MLLYQFWILSVISFILFTLDQFTLTLFLHENNQLIENQQSFYLFTGFDVDHTTS